MLKKLHIHRRTATQSFGISFPHLLSILDSNRASSLLSQNRNGEKIDHIFALDALESKIAGKFGKFGASSVDHLASIDGSMHD